jgi:2-polyprenyl-6-methoxyphenol hydroxylase-like FAD-dependent oxidoreductase
MEETNLKQNKFYWTSCKDCQGLGKRSQRIKKKVRLHYQKELKNYEDSDRKASPPILPKSPRVKCLNCNGSGLVHSETPNEVKETVYPKVAIIGGGIGGVALAVACLHRGISFTLFERDESFDSRAQGYGLILQQASKAIQGFGIKKLKAGIVSTRHLIHSTEGKVLGEWGTQKWIQGEINPTLKRTNIHIARQELRKELLDQLGGIEKIQWNHKLTYISADKEGTELSFDVKGQVKKVKAELVVGADGIRSAVRKIMLGEELFPLRYLGCVVILGICSIKNLKLKEHPLLDLKTVFQTANGVERIYVMPYSEDTVMWQLSFPLSEKDAIILSKKGALALKKEACLRTQWHEPIPEILADTPEDKISGYPVYDRELLNRKHLLKENVTLLGDAAHPMSPFKGQGANQALLDALNLARQITKGCNPYSNWKEIGLRKALLNEFEAEMLKRSAVKVKDSAAAVEFLHSNIVLLEADEPRGRCMNRKKGDNHLSLKDL